MLEEGSEFLILNLLGLLRNLSVMNCFQGGQGLAVLETSHQITDCCYLIASGALEDL